MRWKEKLDDWHPVFCWMPCCVDQTWVWLERVERRRTSETMVGDLFEYRLPMNAQINGLRQEGDG